jgi:hypothetical protein
MPNYQNSKIYTIRCRNDPKHIYVGSTTQSLSKRWGNHKSMWKSGNHYPFHKLIEDIDDWYIELYEERPCNNNDELTRREGQIMREIATLNKNSSNYYLD